MTYVELLLVFLGGVGMMTLYIGAQAIMTGERVYRYCAAYALCWICYFFMIIRIFDDPRIESVVYPFGRIGFPMMAYIVYYRFADAFLDLRRLLPRTFWLFRWTEYTLLMYVAGEAIVCLFFNRWTTTPAHEWVHTAMHLGVAVVSIYGIVQAWSQRNQLAYYFVTGSALLLVFGLTSIVLSMLSTDAIGSTLWQDPLLSLTIGIVLELLCFSLGLNYRHRQTETQRIIREQEIIREHEQRALAQLKAQFFASISHEFRTPLTSMLGPLTDLVQKNPGDATYQLMHRNVSRLLMFVNQLLDLSKLDVEQLHPVIQAGNLTEWLRLLTGSFSSIGDGNDINLTFSTDTKQVSSVEELFLQLTTTVVEQHLGDSSFSVEHLASKLNLSRMQLHRKLKALTNQSATEFIRHIRLQRAADLLAARSATVSEVAFRVGFESLSYFSKSFREQFGVLPSEYEGTGASVT